MTAAEPPVPSAPIPADRSAAGPGDRIGVRVDAMAHGGSAMGRAQDGRMLFVDGALPGETVDARLVTVRDRYAHAVLAALPSDPSPDRLPAPRCDHFGSWPGRGEHPSDACGGCQWGHVDYPAQLRFKNAILRDALARIGRLPDVALRPPIGMDTPWAYRNRIDVHTGPGGLGFVAVDDRSVVPIATCHIAHPSLMELLGALDPDLPPDLTISLRAGVATGDRMIVFHGLGPEPEDVEAIDVDLEASVAVVDAEGQAATVAGRRYLFERLGDRVFAIPPASFFQVNTAMAEHLVSRVRAAVPPGTGRLVDAYSGVGTFAVLLADLADEIYAIEADPAAVQAAADNAAGLEHLTLLEATSAEGLAWLPGPPDVVVVDPPRTGLEPEVVRLLADRRPPTIVYVSCEPATLARDARRLVEAGWLLAESGVVDMFPHTHHIESVTAFRLSGGRSGLERAHRP